MIQSGSLLMALALLVACQLNGRLVSARILDDSEPLDVEAIARAMCEPTGDKQISRLSTVDKLVEFFDEQASDESHELFQCEQQHGAALRLLQDALNTSKKDVCSVAKLALIEHFHKQFVAARGKSSKEESGELAPQLLRHFFMHYALEVDAVCKRNLIRNLERGLKEKLGEDTEEKLLVLEDKENNDPGFNVVFNVAMQRFSDLFSVERSEDALMVWDLIENSPLGQRLTKDGFLIRDQRDSQTGEPIRLLLALKTRGHLDELKEHCHYKLKPIYSKLILPLIKLADLGYSNNGEQLKYELEALKTNEKVKRWFIATQLCEAMLPVKYYEQPSLGPQDVVVITAREAAELREVVEAQSGAVRQPKTQLFYETDTNSMEHIDRLESVALLEPRKLRKSIKRNLKERGRAVRRALIRLVRSLKSSSMRGRLSRIFFSKPAGLSRLPFLTGPPKFPGARRGQFVREAVGRELSESLEGMSEREIVALEASAPFGLEGETSGIGARRQKGPFKRTSGRIYLWLAVMKENQGFFFAYFVFLSAILIWLLLILFTFVTTVG